MKTITKGFEQWQSELENFQSSVKKDLDEIRRCKKEIQTMKDGLLEMMNEASQWTYGKYIRDDHRLILSAPEIIIGNVDKDGVLDNAPSTVIVRGNDVRLEGTALDGTIRGAVTLRAPSIHSIAEDPGKDGTEKAVLATSEIVSQAKSVSLNSENVQGVFTSSASAGMVGVEINSETGISLNATLSSANKKKRLKSAANTRKEAVKSLETEAKNQKKVVGDLMKDLQKLMDFENMTADEITTRVSYLDIDELYDSFNACSSALYEAMAGYFRTLSRLAEANRQMSCLEEMEKEVDKQKSSFKDKSTNTYISLRTENIRALSVDGDGNYRENPGAGVSINAKRVDIGTYKADESLHDESTITLASRKVEISTVNPKVERDNKGEIKKGDFPSVGDVSIFSKNIQMTTVDYEWKDKKMVEKALTKDGKIALRTETVDVSVTDTEGKATGQVEVNAKAVEVKSMDVDKEKRTDKSLAAGSTMLLLSEKMFVGARDSNTKSQQVQVASDKTGVFADTTLELQQAKAVVQLSGGNAAVGGGNLDLYGKTTLQGDVTAKGGITGGDIEMKNMKVKTSFKSPSTSEGIAVPGAPATGKLSAKLKEEELKTKDK